MNIHTMLKSFQVTGKCSEAQLTHFKTQSQILKNVDLNINATLHFQTDDSVPYTLTLNNFFYFFRVIPQHQTDDEEKKHILLYWLSHHNEYNKEIEGIVDGCWSDIVSGHGEGEGIGAKIA